jgi:hypothetical protein
LARQLNIKLTGTKGNLSFYKMYDTYYVRTKSQGGKQTQRTKAKQKDFAIAAALSKRIRLALHTAIPNPKQKAMQNRLTTALLQWQLSFLPLLVLSPTRSLINKSILRPFLVAINNV